MIVAFLNFSRIVWTGHELFRYRLHRRRNKREITELQSYSHRAMQSIFLSLAKTRNKTMGMCRMKS